MQEYQPDRERLPTSTGFVEVQGGRLYYEVAGSGHPLVLFQGTDLLDHRLWDQQFTAFAHSYRVVRYDARGCGKSPSSTTPYTEASDLVHLFQALQIEKSYLLDFGVRSLLDFMYSHASFVEGLILVSPEIRTVLSF